MEAVQKSQAIATLYQQLAQPFDLKYLKYRIGAKSKDKTKAIALFYLDAREVTRRLNDVLGLDGWSTKQNSVTSGGKLVGVKCELSIRMPYKDVRGNYVWNTKTDFGEPSKTAPLKGGASDALKRAAVLFGVGRYLYYIPNHWFQLNEYGYFEDPNAPREWLENTCKWAIPGEEAPENWENVAALEYQPEDDIDLDELIFEDKTAREILGAKDEKIEELKAYLRSKREES